MLHSNLLSQSRGSELCTEPQAASDSEGPGSDTPWLLAPSPGACLAAGPGAAWLGGVPRLGRTWMTTGPRPPGLPRTSPVQVMLFNNNSHRPAGKKGPEAAGEGPSAEGRPVSHPGNLATLIYKRARQADRPGSLTVGPSAWLVRDNNPNQIFFKVGPTQIFLNTRIGLYIFQFLVG